MFVTTNKIKVLHNLFVHGQSQYARVRLFLSHSIFGINWVLPTLCSSQSPLKRAIAHPIDFPTIILLESIHHRTPNGFGQDLNIAVVSENYSLKPFEMAMAYLQSNHVAGLFLQAVLVAVLVMISSVQGLFPKLSSHHI
jgi:hypothetical protein